MLFTIVCFAVMIVLIVQMVRQMNANKAVQPVVNLIRKIDDQEEFLKGADEGIAGAKNEMQKTKFQILKLWGLATYGMYEEYDALLPEIHTNTLMGNKQAPNDDSLFYMVLAIPNILQKDHQMEKADALLARIKEDIEGAENRLDYQIGLACNDAYADRNDKGVSFFEKVMDGDYGEYEYQKNLISLYKETVSAMLYKHYMVINDQDKVQDVLPLVESYNETRIGETWLKNIGASLPEEEEKEEETSEETEESTESEEQEDSAEHASEETSDGLSASGDSFADETKEKDE